METLGLALLGLLLLGLAAWALLHPDGLMRWIEGFWRGGDRIALVAGLRIAVGGYLIAVARATSWPTVTVAIGVVFMLAGAAVVAMGRDRIDRILAWWLERPTIVVRSISIVWVAFAALFFYLGFAHA